MVLCGVRQAVEALRAEGCRVYSIEQVEESIPLQSFEVEEGIEYAVILGNEVKGVQQQVVELVTRMHGTQ